MIEFVKPSIEYFELTPLFIVFAAACVGVIVEAFVPRVHRYLTQTLVTMSALVLALGAVVMVALDFSAAGSEASHADGAA